MTKKAYLLAGVAVLIIVAAIGIYWYSQKPEVSVLPDEQEMVYETESLSQDIADLEIMEEDKNLETLEEDLATVDEETPPEQKLPPRGTAVDVSEIVNLESELDTELAGFSNDLTDLEGFEGDVSLDNLDDALFGF